MTAISPNVPDTRGHRPGDEAIADWRAGNPVRVCIPSEPCPTESYLLSWALGRAGFPALVSVGREPTAFAETGRFIAPRFAVHLSRAAEVDEVIHALLAVQPPGRGVPRAVLLIWQGNLPYRERLRMDAQQRLIAIHRQFQRNAGRRAMLAGVAWRLDARETPNAGALTPTGSPWRSVRRVLRSMGGRPARRITRVIVGPGAAESGYFHGPRARRRPVYDFFKRAFDIAFSLIVLAVTLPICVPVAMFIKLWDRGPIFFAHRREGLNGHAVGCLKFRTMVPNADAFQKQLRALNEVDGPQFKLTRDPRVTPLGRFLRRTNIDELPQFLNVLSGQMSVVGPRPSPFEENQLCPAWREARLSVRPGITGLWQVSRSPARGPTDFQEWIYFDTQYVERRGFGLDLRILLLTVKQLSVGGK